MDQKRLLLSLWTLFFVCGFLGISVLVAQDDPAGDDDTLPVRLCGWTKLAPPTDAANQDATGSVKLRQWGERMAIHVYVRHLEPGATYNVSMSRPVEGQDPEVAELGTITTHDGVPPAPRCFRATLKVVEPVEEEPAEGEEDAGGGGCFGHDWHWPWGHHSLMSGMAVFMLNEEGTALEYDFYIRGASGAEVTASIALGGDPAVTIVLPLDEELKGSVEVTTDELTILASGEASLAVTVTPAAGEGEEVEVTELAGTVKTCFPEEWREKMAARRAGTGALRLDTERDDAMPFGVTDLEALAGAAISVKDTAGAVVLAGTVGEFVEFPAHRSQHGGDDAAAGGGGSLDDEAEVLEVADDDLYFEVPELHDASFVRGDVNEDSRVNLSDPIALLGHLFLGAAGPYCRDSADANDNGEVDLADPIVMLLVLFQGQASIAAPYPQKGFDGTPDVLFCGTSE
jgi:hypothetical protein